VGRRRSGGTGVARTLPGVSATPDERDAVRALLGREPTAEFSVVVRRRDGAPVVIRNAPFTADGTPMPTRYWLVDPEWNRTVGRLEADGGVRAAEAVVDPVALAAAHAACAADRDAAIPGDHTGPRPSAGVGGTRTGVKCLHAHAAWWLVSGVDPVGDWIADRLDPALLADLADPAGVGAPRPGPAPTADRADLAGVSGPRPDLAPTAERADRAGAVTAPPVGTAGVGA